MKNGLFHSRTHTRNKCFIQSVEVFIFFIAIFIRIKIKKILINQNRVMNNNNKKHRIYTYI